MDPEEGSSPKCFSSNLDGAKSPIASVQRTRSTLAGHSEGPHGTNTAPTNANRAIRTAAQRTQGLQGPNSVFLEGDMNQNASDSNRCDKSRQRFCDNSRAISLRKALLEGPQRGSSKAMLQLCQLRFERKDFCGEGRGFQLGEFAGRAAFLRCWLPYPCP